MKDLLTVARAIGLLEAGKSIPLTARHLKVSWSAVRVWFIEFQQQRNVSRGKSSNGRPNTTPRLARQNRFTNCSVLKSFWREAVSRWIVNGRIRRGGLYLSLSSETILSPANRVAKYRWARNHVFCRPERFQRVVWSDESWFRLFKNHGRVRVWRQPGERYRDDPIQYSRQAGDGSVHVWAPFGLMAGFLFKFFSRMSMAKCAAESSTTLLVEVAFQMSVDSAARPCSCSPISSSHSVPRRQSSFNTGVTLQDPYYEPDRTCVGTTSVGEQSSRVQRLYPNSSGYCSTSGGKFPKTSLAA